MDYTEIIKLLDAGYTREEILNMKETVAEPPADPAPAEDTPEPVSMDAVMEEVKNMFSEMKKELTAMNILNSRQGADEVRSSEEILASIINPMKRDGGN